jgi:hypothetical protein
MEGLPFLAAKNRRFFAAKKGISLFSDRDVTRVYNSSMKSLLVRKNILIVLLCLFVGLLSFAYGLAAGTYKLPPYSAFASARNYAEAHLLPITPTPAPNTAQADYPEVMSKIVALVKQQNFQTKTEQIDYVREFIYQNSQHGLDAESAKYRLELPVTLKMLWDYSQTHQNPPLLECSSRTVAMLYILDSLGIRSRMVNVFTSDFDTLRSHTFLEAYNPDSSHWEIQDPDYDIYYVYKANSARVSTSQILLEPLGQFQVQSKFPDQVDTASHSVLPHYFQAVVYHDELGGVDMGIVNSTRFSFKGGGKDLYSYVKHSFGKVPFLTVQEFEALQ